MAGSRHGKGIHNPWLAVCCCCRTHDAGCTCSEMMFERFSRACRKRKKDSYVQLADMHWTKTIHTYLLYYGGSPEHVKLQRWRACMSCARLRATPYNIVETAIADAEVQAFVIASVWCLRKEMSQEAGDFHAEAQAQAGANSSSIFTLTLF